MQHMVKMAKKHSESGRSWKKGDFQGSKVDDRNSMNSGHFSKEYLPSIDRPLSEI